MKPRIYKQRGLWYCYSRDGIGRVMGLGYTPRMAWEDWKSFSQAAGGAR